MIRKNVQKYMARGYCFWSSKAMISRQGRRWARHLLMFLTIDNCYHILVYYINWSASKEFPQLRDTVSPHVKNYDNFMSVWDLLTRHSPHLEPWRNGTANKIHSFLLVRCLHDKKIIHSGLCLTRYLTRSLRSLARYLVQHLKRNSITPRVHELNSI